MNEALQIIGSIASIGSIPLAIYFFLKSQVQKYLDIRREIVNRLSFQIGEGRKLSLFEIQAVIESRVRDNRIKSGVIRPDEIIEDLVTETINSPLLESARKEEIVISLSELHSLGKLHALVSSDAAIFKDFLGFLRESKQETEVDAVEAALEKETDEAKKTKTANAPEVFAAISGIFGAIAVLITLVDFTGNLKVLPKLLDSDIVTSLALGVAASIIGASLTAIINIKRR